MEISLTRHFLLIDGIPNLDRQPQHFYREKNLQIPYF